MRFNKIYLILIVFLVAGLVFLITAEKEHKEIPEHLKVAATIFPIYDIAKNIAGNKIEVINIVPPGASPHTFEVTPSDIKRLYSVRVVFSVGHILDEWTAEITDAIGGMEVFPVSDGIILKPLKFKHRHKHREGKGKSYDPHYWISTVNAEKIAENIKDKLIELDKQNIELYNRNFNLYKKKLDEARDTIKLILKPLTNRKMIVFHESWNYFASEFDLEITGVFTPSAGSEPSPRHLKKLYDLTSEHNIRAVFSEPQLSKETIIPFTRDLDLKIHTIDPIGGVEERNTFIDTLIYNARTIRKALYAVDQ